MKEVFSTDRYTLQQIADHVGVHHSTVWRWVLVGVRSVKLPAFKIGGRIFVREGDLEEFLTLTTNHTVVGTKNQLQRVG